jgi:hypothetical protein
MSRETVPLIPKYISVLITGMSQMAFAEGPEGEFRIGRIREVVKTIF